MFNEDIRDDYNIYIRISKIEIVAPGVGLKIVIGISAVIYTVHNNGQGPTTYYTNDDSQYFCTE